MTDRSTRVAVLGSTGSIGRNALEVIAAAPGRLQAIGLAAFRSTAALEEQARQAKPAWIVVADADAAQEHDWSQLPRGIERLSGPEALERAVQRADVDTVLSAIVGSAGLRSTWAALEAGKTVALANKETLVVAGPLAIDLARRRGAMILPVDSEHSAIFQAMQAGRRDQVRRVILTASGGPFRNHSAEQLEQVTVDEALAHPNWSMGRKITIDSATMMNKALELIEARWLFDLDESQIEVVVHPQSIVHSMVEFVDGSVIAQMSPPDMKLPIQGALTWPDRLPGVAAKMDWARELRLEFEPADPERFPALELGREVARRGGTAGAVLNAANEAAVAGFLSGELRFTDIVPSCRAIVEQHAFEPSPSLERLFELDRWARQEVARWVCA
ncbi:MAG TPA: 1-deoxy-D-xylulose-5-phosphate reductoisomerase [Pirellulales bacterium]|jgi:1-deoxy-D-xylulose-5-phosphate reductoisomerase|nr:1-deoxy-D-xylulose-5-phosphate reductoisomerase [Pirellulales bacterium]